MSSSDFGQPGFWVVVIALACAAVYSFIFLFYLPRITGYIITFFVRFFILDTKASFHVKSALFAPLKCQVFLKGVFFQDENLSISVVEGGLAFPILYTDPKYCRLREDMLSNDLLNLPCLVDSHLTKRERGIIEKVDLKKKKVYVRVVDSEGGKEKAKHQSPEGGFSSGAATSFGSSRPLAGGREERKWGRKNRRNPLWTFSRFRSIWNSDTPFKSLFMFTSSQEEDEDEEEEEPGSGDFEYPSVLELKGGVQDGEARGISSTGIDRLEGGGTRKAPPLQGQARGAVKEEIRGNKPILNRPPSSHISLFSYPSTPMPQGNEPSSGLNTSIGKWKGEKNMTAPKDVKEPLPKTTRVGGKGGGAGLLAHSEYAENAHLDHNMDTSHAFNVDSLEGGRQNRWKEKAVENSHTHFSKTVPDDTGVFTFPRVDGEGLAVGATSSRKSAREKDGRKRWHRYDSILLPQTYSRCRCFANGLRLSLYNASRRYDALVAVAQEVKEAESYFKNADLQKRKEWCSSAQDAYHEEQKENGMHHAKKVISELARYLLFNRHRTTDMTRENVAKYIQKQQVGTKTFAQRFFEFVRAVEVDVHNVSCSVGGASQVNFPFFFHLSSHRLSGSCYQTREGLASPLDLYRTVFDFSLQEVGIRVAEMSAEEKELPRDEKGTDEYECSDTPEKEWDDNRKNGSKESIGEGGKGTTSSESEPHTTDKGGGGSGSHARKLPPDVFSVIVHPREENVIHIRVYLDAPNVYAGEEIVPETLPHAGMEVSLNLQQISFGPWAELVRRQLVEFFFPRNFLPLKPLNIQLGEPRPRTPFDVVVTFLQTTTLDLKFKRQSITVRPPVGVFPTSSTGILSVKLGATSEFIYRSGFLFPGNGCQNVKMLFSGKEMKVMVNAVLGLPCTLAQMDSVQCYIDRCDPLLWNECKLWDITAVLSKGYCTYNTSYIPFFQDFLTDWEFSEATYLGAECSPKTFHTTQRFVDEFIPQVRKVNIIIQNIVELQFNLNRQNVIYDRDPFCSRKNALAVMKVFSAQVEMDLSSDQYILRSRNEISRPVHVITEKITIFFSLPPSHPCHDVETEAFPFLSVEKLDVKAVYTAQLPNQAKPAVPKKNNFYEAQRLDNHLELSVCLCRILGNLHGRHIKAIFRFFDNYFMDNTESIAPRELFWLFPILQRKEGFGKNTKKEWNNYWGPSRREGKFLETQVSVKITDVETTVASLCCTPPLTSSQACTREENIGSAMNDGAEPKTTMKWDRQRLAENAENVLLLRCPEFVFTLTKTLGVTEYNITIKPISIRWIQNDLWTQNYSPLTSLHQKPLPKEKGQSKREPMSARGGRHLLHCPGVSSLLHSDRRKNMSEEEGSFLCVGNVLITLVDHYGPLPLRSIVQRIIHVDVCGIRFDVAAAHLYHLICLGKVLEYEIVSCEDRSLELAIVNARQEAEKYVMQNKMEQDGESDEDLVFPSSPRHARVHLHKKTYDQVAYVGDSRNKQDRVEVKHASSKHRGRYSHHRGHHQEQFQDYNVQKNSSGVLLPSSSRASIVFGPMSPLFGRHKTNKSKGKKQFVLHGTELEKKDDREERKTQKDGNCDEQMHGPTSSRDMGGEGERWIKASGDSNTFTREPSIGTMRNEEMLEDEGQRKNELDGDTREYRWTPMNHLSTSDMQQQSSISAFSPSRIRDKISFSAIFKNKYEQEQQHHHQKKNSKKGKGKKNESHTWDNMEARSTSSSKESSFEMDNSNMTSTATSCSAIPFSSPASDRQNRGAPTPTSPSAYVKLEASYIPIIPPFGSLDDPFNVPPHLAVEFANFLDTTEKEKELFKMYGLTFLHASVGEISGVIRLASKKAEKEEQKRRGREKSAGETSSNLNAAHGTSFPMGFSSASSPTSSLLLSPPSSSFSSSDLFWLHLPQGVHLKSSSLQTLASMSQMSVHLPSIQLHGMRSASIVCPLSVLSEYHHYQHQLRHQPPPRPSRQGGGFPFSSSSSPAPPGPSTSHLFPSGSTHGKPNHTVPGIRKEEGKGKSNPVVLDFSFAGRNVGGGAGPRSHDASHVLRTFCSPQGMPTSYRPVFTGETVAPSSWEDHSGFAVVAGIPSVGGASRPGIPWDTRGGGRQGGLPTSLVATASAPSSMFSLSFDASSSSMTTSSSVDEEDPQSSAAGVPHIPHQSTYLHSSSYSLPPPESSKIFSQVSGRSEEEKTGRGQPKHHLRHSANNVGEESALNPSLVYRFDNNTLRVPEGTTGRRDSASSKVSSVGGGGGGKQGEELEEESEEVGAEEKGKEGKVHSMHDTGGKKKKTPSKPPTRELLVRVFYFSSGCTFIHHTKVSGRDSHRGEHVQAQREWFAKKNVHGLLHQCFLTENGLRSELGSLDGDEVGVSVEFYASPSGRPDASPLTRIVSTGGDSPNNNNDNNNRTQPKSFPSVAPEKQLPQTIQLLRKSSVANVSRGKKPRGGPMSLTEDHSARPRSTVPQFGGGQESCSGAEGTSYPSDDVVDSREELDPSIKFCRLLHKGYNNDDHYHAYPDSDQNSDPAASRVNAKESIDVPDLRTSLKVRSPFQGYSCSMYPSSVSPLNRYSGTEISDAQKSKNSAPEGEIRNRTNREAADIPMGTHLSSDIHVPISQQSGTSCAPLSPLLFLTPRTPRLCSQSSGSATAALGASSAFKLPSSMKKGKTDGVNQRANPSSPGGKSGTHYMVRFALPGTSSPTRDTTNEEESRLQDRPCMVPEEHEMNSVIDKTNPFLSDHRPRRRRRRSSNSRSRSSSIKSNNSDEISSNSNANNSRNSANGNCSPLSSQSTISQLHSISYPTDLSTVHDVGSSQRFLSCKSGDSLSSDVDTEDPLDFSQHHHEGKKQEKNEEEKVAHQINKSPVNSPHKQEKRSNRLEIETRRGDTPSLQLPSSTEIASPVESSLRTSHWNKRMIRNENGPTLFSLSKNSPSLKNEHRHHDPHSSDSPEIPLRTGELVLYQQKVLADTPQRIGTAEEEKGLSSSKKSLRSRPASREPSQTHETLLSSPEAFHYSSSSETSYSSSSMMTSSSFSDMDENEMEDEDDFSLSSYHKPSFPLSIDYGPFHSEKEKRNTRDSVFHCFGSPEDDSFRGRHRRGGAGIGGHAVEEEEVGIGKAGYHSVGSRVPHRSERSVHVQKKKSVTQAWKFYSYFEQLPLDTIVESSDFTGPTSARTATGRSHTMGAKEHVWTTYSPLVFHRTLTALSYNPHRLANDGSVDRTGFTAPLPNVFFSCVLPSLSSEEPYVRQSSKSEAPAFSPLEEERKVFEDDKNAQETNDSGKEEKKEVGQSGVQHSAEIQKFSRNQMTDSVGREQRIFAFNDAVEASHTLEPQQNTSAAHSGSNSAGGSNGGPIIGKREVNPFRLNLSHSHSSSEVNVNPQRQADPGATRLDVLSSAWRAPRSSIGHDQHIIREHISVEFQPESTVRLSAEMCSLLASIIGFFRSCVDEATKSSRTIGEMMMREKEMRMTDPHSSNTALSFKMGMKDLQAAKYSSKHIVPSSIKGVSPRNVFLSQTYNNPQNHLSLFNSLSSTASAPRKRKNRGSDYSTEPCSSRPSKSPNSRGTSPSDSAASPSAARENYNILEERTPYTVQGKEEENETSHSAIYTQWKATKSAQVFYRMRKPLKVYVVHGRIPKLKIDISGRAILKNEPSHLNEAMKLLMSGGTEYEDGGFRHREKKWEQGGMPSVGKGQSSHSTLSPGFSHDEGRKRAKQREGECVDSHSFYRSPNSFHSSFNALLSPMQKPSIVRLSVTLYDLNMFFQKKPKTRSSRHALLTQKEFFDGPSAGAATAAMFAPPEFKTFSLIVRHSDVLTVCSINEHSRWKDPLKVDIPHFLRTTTLSKESDASMHSANIGKGKSKALKGALSSRVLSSRCVVGVVYAGDGSSVVCASAVPRRVAVSPLSLGSIKGYFTRDVGYVVSMVGCMIREIQECKAQIIRKENDASSFFPSSSQFPAVPGETFAGRLGQPRADNDRDSPEREITQKLNCTEDSQDFSVDSNMHALLQTQKATKDAAVYLTDPGLAPDAEERFSDSFFERAAIRERQGNNWEVETDASTSDLSFSSSDTQGDTQLRHSAVKIKELQVEAKINLQCIYVELYNIIPETEVSLGGIAILGGKNVDGHKKHYTWKHFSRDRSPSVSALSSMPHAQNSQFFKKQQQVLRQRGHGIQRWVVNDEPNSCAIGPCFIHVSSKQEKQWELSKLCINAASHLSSFRLQIYPNLLLNMVQIMLHSVLLSPSPNSFSFENNEHANNNSNPAEPPFTSSRPQSMRKGERAYSRTEFLSPSFPGKQGNQLLGEKARAGNHSAIGGISFPFFSLRNASHFPSDTGNTPVQRKPEQVRINKSSAFFPSLPHERLEVNFYCRLGKLETCVRHSKDNFFRFGVQDIVLSHSTAPQSAHSTSAPENNPYVDINRLSVFVKTRLWYLGVKAKLKFLNRSSIAPSMLSLRPRFNSTSSFMLRSMTWSYHPDTSPDGKALHKLLNSLYSSEKRKIGEMKIVLEEACAVVHHCVVKAIRCQQQHLSLQLSGINVDIPHIPHFIEIIYPQLQHLIFAWRYSLFSSTKIFKEYSSLANDSSFSFPSSTRPKSSSFNVSNSPSTDGKGNDNGWNHLSGQANHSSSTSNWQRPPQRQSSKSSYAGGPNFQKGMEPAPQSPRKLALRYPWRDEIPSLTDNHEFAAAGTSYSFWVLVRVQDISLCLGLDMNLVQEYRLPKLLCFAESSDHRWKVKTEIFSCVVSSFPSVSPPSLSGDKGTKERRFRGGTLRGQREKYGNEKCQQDILCAQVTLPRIFFDFSGDEKKLSLIGAVESIKANITTVLLQHTKLTLQKVQKELLPLLRPIPLPKNRGRSSSCSLNRNSPQSSNPHGRSANTSASEAQHSSPNRYKLIALQKQLYRQRTFAFLFCGGRTSCGANSGVLRCSINYLSVFGRETPQSFQKQMRWSLNLDKGEVALTDRIKSIAYDEKRSRRNADKVYYQPSAATSNKEYEKQKLRETVDPSVLSRIYHPSSFRESVIVTPQKSFSRGDDNNRSSHSTKGSNVQDTSHPGDNVSSVWSSHTYGSANAFRSSPSGKNEKSNKGGGLRGKSKDPEKKTYSRKSEKKMMEYDWEHPSYQNSQRPPSRRTRIKDHTEINGFVWASFAFSGKLKSVQHVEYKVRELPDNADLRALLLNRFKESIIRCEASILSPICILRIGAPVVATQFVDEIKTNIHTLSRLSLRVNKKSLGALQHEERFQELRNTTIKILKAIQRADMEEKQKFDIMEKEITKELLMRESAISAKSISRQRTFITRVNQAGMIIPLGDYAYHQVVAYVNNIASHPSSSHAPLSPDMVSQNIFQTKNFVPHFAFKVETDLLGAQVKIKELYQPVWTSEDSYVDNFSPTMKAVGYLHANSLKAFFTDGTALLFSPPSVYSSAVVRSTIFGGRGILSLSNRKEEFYESRNTLVIPSIVMPFHLEQVNADKVSKWRSVVNIASPVLQCSPWIYVIISELRSEFGYASPFFTQKRDDKKQGSVTPVTIEQQSLAVLHHLKNNGPSRLRLSSLMMNPPMQRRETLKRKSRILSLASSLSLEPKMSKDNAKEERLQEGSQLKSSCVLLSKKLRGQRKPRRRFSGSAHMASPITQSRKTRASHGGSNEDLDSEEVSEADGELKTNSNSIVLETAKKPKEMHVDVSARLERGKFYIFSHTYCEDSTEGDKRQKSFERPREDGLPRGTSASAKRRSASSAGTYKMETPFFFTSLAGFRSSLFGPAGDKDIDSTPPLSSEGTDHYSTEGVGEEPHYRMDYEAEKMDYLSFFYLPSAVVHGYWRKGENEEEGNFSDSELKSGSSLSLRNHCIVRAEVDLTEIRLSPSLFMVTEEMKLVKTIFQKMKLRRQREMIQKMEALKEGVQSKAFFHHLHCSPTEIFLPIPHSYTDALLARWKEECPANLEYIHSDAFSNFDGETANELSNDDSCTTSSSSTGTNSWVEGSLARARTQRKRERGMLGCGISASQQRGGFTSSASTSSAQAGDAIDSMTGSSTSIHLSMRHFNLVLDTSPIYTTSFSCFLGEEGSVDLLLQLYKPTNEEKKKVLVSNQKPIPEQSITLHVNQLRAECQTRLEVKSLEVYIPEITVAISQSSTKSKAEPRRAKIRTRTISLNFPFKGEFSQQNALLRLQHFSQVFLVHQIWSPTLITFIRTVGEVVLPSRVKVLKKESKKSSQNSLEGSASGSKESSFSNSHDRRRFHTPPLQMLETFTGGKRLRKESSVRMKEGEDKKKNNTKINKKRLSKDNLYFVASVTSGWFEVDMGGGNIQHLNSGSLNFGFQQSITPHDRTLHRAKLRLKDMFMKSDGILSGSLRVSNAIFLMYKLNNFPESESFYRTNEGRTCRFHTQVDGIVCTYKERHIKEVLDWKAESFMLQGMDEVSTTTESNLLYLTAEVKRSKLRLTPTTMPAILNFLYSFNVIIRNRRSTAQKRIQSALQGKSMPYYIIKTLQTHRQIHLPSSPHPPTPIAIRSNSQVSSRSNEDHKLSEVNALMKEKESYIVLEFPGKEEKCASFTSGSSEPLRVGQSCGNSEKKKSELKICTYSPAHDRSTDKGGNKSEKSELGSKTSLSLCSSSNAFEKMRGVIPFIGGEFERIPCGQVKLSISNAAITFGDVDGPKSLNMVVVQFPFASVCFAECTSDNNTTAKRFLQLQSENVEFFRPAPTKSLIMGLKGKNILDFYTSQKLGCREVGYTLDLSQEHPWTGNPLYRDFSEVLELVNQFINNSNAQILKKMMTGNYDDGLKVDNNHHHTLFSANTLSSPAMFPVDGSFSKISSTKSMTTSLSITQKGEVNRGGGRSSPSPAAFSKQFAEKAELRRVQDPRTFRALRSVKFSPQVRFGGDVSVNTEVILNWFGVTEKVLPRAIHCSLCDKLEKILDVGVRHLTNAPLDHNIMVLQKNENEKKEKRL